MTTESNPAGSGAVSKPLLPPSLSIPQENEPPAGEAQNPQNQTENTEGQAPDNQSPSQSDAASQDTPESDEQRQKRRDRISERIGRYAQRAKAAEAALRHAQSVIQQLRRPVRPQSTEGLDYEQTERMRGIDSATEALRRRDLQTEQRRAESAAQERQQVTYDTVFAKLEAGEERFPKLREQAIKIDNLSEETVRYLEHSDKAPEIVHHLIKNPDVANQLYDLTDARTADYASMVEAIRIMARIEASIDKPQPRKATKAPAPGTTLNGGAPPGGSKSLEELSSSDERVSDAFASSLTKTLKERRRR